MKRSVFFLLAGILLVAPALVAAPVNVALNKPVTPIGLFGNTTNGVWPDDPSGAPGLLTDGIFSPDQGHWQVGTIWWNENDTLPKRYLVIDLQGSFLINGAIVQGDNNDAYILEYLDTADTWQSLWEVANSCCWGMANRPDRFNTLLIQSTSPVVAKKVRLSGALPSDRYYSAAEVQIFGTPNNVPEVPEPSSLVLSALGLLAISGILRRRL